MSTFLVKTLSGEIIMFDVSIDLNRANASALYVRLSLKTRNPNDVWIPMYVNNKLIDFNKKLSDYNITKESMLSQRIYASSRPSDSERRRIHRMRYLINQN